MLQLLYSTHLYLSNHNQNVSMLLIQAGCLWCLRCVLADYLMIKTKQTHSIHPFVVRNILTIGAIRDIRNTTITISQILSFMGPTWGPPGSCRPQVGPTRAPLTLLSGITQHLRMPRGTGRSCRMKQAGCLRQPPGNGKTRPIYFLRSRWPF